MKLGKLVFAGDHTANHRQLVSTYIHTYNTPKNYIQAITYLPPLNRDGFRLKDTNQELCLLEYFSTPSEQESNEQKKKREARNEEAFAIRENTYPGTDVLFIAFSVTDPASFAAIETRWMPEIMRHCKDTRIVLVGTNIEKRGAESITEAQGKALAARIQQQQKYTAVPYMECNVSQPESVHAVLAAATPARPVAEKEPGVIATIGNALKSVSTIFSSQPKPPPAAAALQPASSSPAPAPVPAPAPLLRKRSSFGGSLLGNRTSPASVSTTIDDPLAKIIAGLHNQLVEALTLPSEDKALLKESRKNIGTFYHDLAQTLDDKFVTKAVTNNLVGNAKTHLDAIRQTFLQSPAKNRKEAASLLSELGYRWHDLSKPLEHIKLEQRDGQYCLANSSSSRISGRGV